MDMGERKKSQRQMHEKYGGQKETLKRGEDRGSERKRKCD